MTSFAETAASFLPGHFEAYARVSHPLEYTGSLPDAQIGPLVEHLEPATTFIHQSANLWFPADQSWCVATEIDLAWTYIGGSRRCVASILADSRLETAETTAAAVHE